MESEDIMAFVYNIKHRSDTKRNIHANVVTESLVIYIIIVIIIIINTLAMSPCTK